MPGRIVRRGVRRDVRVPGMRDIYPSEFARSKIYPKLGPESKAEEDREPNAIKCAQCSLPIADSTAVAACPHCGSDNMRGHEYLPVQK